MTNNDHINGESQLPDDPFEKEAREGFDMLGEQESQALKAATDLRFKREIMREQPRRRWFIAAAASALLLTFLLILNWLMPSEKKEVAIIEPKSVPAIPKPEAEKDQTLTTIQAEPAKTSERDTKDFKTVTAKQKARRESEISEDVLSPSQMAAPEGGPEMNAEAKKSDKEKEEADKDLRTADIPALATNSISFQNSGAAMPSAQFTPAEAKSLQYTQVAATSPAKKSAMLSVNESMAKSPLIMPVCEYGPGSDSLHYRVQQMLKKNGLNKSFDAALTVNTSGKVIAADVMTKPTQDNELSKKIAALLVGLDGFYTVSNGKQKKFSYSLQYRP